MSASGGVAWFSSATLGILTARLVRVQLAADSNSRLAGGLGGTSLVALGVVPAAAIDDDQGTHASTAPLVMLTTSDATMVPNIHQNQGARTKPSTMGTMDHGKGGCATNQATAL